MDSSAGLPVQPGERIVALDVLRGFAMLGVLVAYCAWSLGTAPEPTWTGLDRALGFAIGLVVDGKFYSLLALLFGLGFSLQLARAGGADAPAAAIRRYLRRLAVLAAIGLVHALTLRNGDILLPYAVAGFLLVPFRRASDRLLIAAALLILLVPSIARWAWEAAGAALPQRPQGAGRPWFAENYAWVRYWYSTALFNWPPNLSLFLVGLWAGRHRLVQRLAAAPALARRLALAGIVAGAALFGALQALGGGALAGWPALQRLAASLAFSLHAFAFAVGYAALLLLALRTRAGTRLLTPLAAVGRMALTNYLMQAALIVPLCLAFGWFDLFTPTSALLLAAAVFALQLPFSRLWLKRFAWGPAEYLWRRLTYGRGMARRAAEAEL